MQKKSNMLVNGAETSELSYHVFKAGQIMVFEKSGATI